MQQQLEFNAERVQQLEEVQQQQREFNAERLEQLEEVQQQQQQQLELSLERESTLRKRGDRDNGERFVWLAERVSQVAHGPDS